MKILVIGLDCAVPELLFGDERLVNFRRLMDGGCYQDPGSLGVYGFRNRADHSCDALATVTGAYIAELRLLQRKQQ